MNPRVLFLLCTAGGSILAEEPARIQVFMAMPAVVRRGSPVTLTWSATGTDRVKLEPLGVQLPSKGTLNHALIGRTTFWLSAVNAWGGQTLPVVVDVLPDEPPSPPPAIAPPTPPPVQPPVQPPAKSAASSPVPAPVPKVAKPSAMPAPPAEAGAIWIQFAALSAPASIARLQGDLRRAAGIETVLSDVADPQVPGLTLKRVRLGPFATPRAAKARLQELKPRLAGLALKPYVDRGEDPAPKAHPRRRRSGNPP
ncbi:SPOR domain-containing protein [Geothrix sp. 21YS21S-2]|uniref:SPOR domain-containing protein n=1 Tax=Geothrix sp. 21YS21S-2 TaxID=3068893 RepID=UPI0027B9C193|nr:SPOR domain-containing protein [Geothrix sp. 21YS21S-2]